MELSGLRTACRMVIKNIMPAIVPLIILGGCDSKNETLPFYNTADFTAQWIDKSDPQYSKIHTIDTFRFKNQLGCIVNKDTLNGHIYVANFFFCECPGICPKMMTNLEAVQKRFSKNDDVKLVSFTVMPWKDSVKTLFEYGNLHQINPQKWYLLTGNKSEIYRLGRQSYFSEKQAGLLSADNSFLHTESLLLVDKKSRIRGIYNATDTLQIKHAIDDINILLAEK